MTYQGPWNLIPRTGQQVPWTCSRHGQVDTTMCAKCRAEYEKHREQASTEAFREQIMELYDLPQELREKWRAGWREDSPSVTCPRCGMTSYNENDIKQGYCGNCHDWTLGP